jgi:phosphoglycolate phosphatase
MPQADAVLFDLDGVLVDSRVPFARCVNGALTANGLPVQAADELHRFLGPPLHQTFMSLGAGALVQSCVDEYRRLYSAAAAEMTPVFGGIRETLSTLSVHVPLGVATSKPLALADPLLNALGLRSYFATVAGPDLETEHESKGTTIARALAQLPGVNHAVMVGDRNFDMVGAAENGLGAIGVLWGIGDEEELRDAGAHALADSPEDLLGLLGFSTR